MRTLTISRWSLPAAGAAMVAAAAIAISMGPAQAAGTMVVHVKQASIADHAADCPGGVTGAHFVINQIASGPASIDVELADGSSQTVAKSKQSGPVAHYDAWFTGTLVKDATASVPNTWTGQFVLSNYYCGPSTSTTSSSSSSSSSSSTTSSTPTS
jgi:hypothetical protein